MAKHLNLDTIEKYTHLNEKLAKKLDGHAKHLRTEIENLTRRLARIEEILATKPTYNRDRTY